jgi:hypothetical protein
MYTYQDLITQVRDIVRDPATRLNSGGTPVTINNKFFTDTELLVWLSVACGEIVRECKFSTFMASMSVVADLAEYPYADNLLRISAVYDSDNRRIFPTTITDLDSTDPLWRDRAAGKIRAYYPTMLKAVAGEDPDILSDVGFFPKPDTDETLTVYGWRLPVLPAAGNTLTAASLPPLEDMILSLSLDYVLARCYEKQKKHNEAMLREQKFYGQNIKKIKDYLYTSPDGVKCMGSNEVGGSTKQKGTLPEWYPATGWTR